jgi:hypothetical protein
MALRPPTLLRMACRGVASLAVGIGVERPWRADAQRDARYQASAAILPCAPGHRDSSS